MPLANAYDLSHAHSAFVKMCNADVATALCKMDGAGDICLLGDVPCQAAVPVLSTTPPVSSLLTSNWRAGIDGQLYVPDQSGAQLPAHQFLFGGTSAPSAADDAAGIFAAENMSGTASTAGCIADADTTVDLITPSGENRKIYPCFEHADDGRSAGGVADLAILHTECRLHLDGAQCDSAYLPIKRPRWKMHRAGLGG